MLTEIKKNLAREISPLISIEESVLSSTMESPKNNEHGHLSFPVFSLAKTLKKAPPLIAKELAEKIQSQLPDSLEAVEPLSGFLNFKFKSSYLMEAVETNILSAPDKIGQSDEGRGKKVVIDFSSPNVAKPMSIGHLRATVIGQAICNLAKSRGYEVVGLNHLGDWGTQFGKLAWAYSQWGSEYDFENKAFESLYALYVRFHNEADENKQLDELGAAEFRKLEAGDEEVTQLWKWFVEISLKEYQRLWDLLGVRHELVRGESFYNDLLKPTEQRLKSAGILKESEGAMVVEMDDPKMPPCLITKSDGASLYATRDLASAIYRVEDLKADVNLYVVGVDQTLHFRQVFEVLKKMGFDWWETCHHISFGMYRFKDMGRMSSRKGNIIVFEDVVSKAIEMVRTIIEEKNPDLNNKDEVAVQVGVGAIIFNDLVNDRVKNVDFDWDRVLDFEGNSGPYVQYCNVRCKSLIRKSGEEVLERFSAPLDSFEESQLMWSLLGFENVLAQAHKHYKPHLVATWLLDICRQFSSFYAKHPILNAEDDIRRSRLTLVQSTGLVIEKALEILNIQAPQEM